MISHFEGAIIFCGTRFERRWRAGDSSFYDRRFTC